MKKVFALLLVAGMFAVVSCGPSAEEKAKAEQATKDSIANVEKATADSIAAVQTATADSLAMVATEVAKADSIAAAAKGGKATKTVVKTTVKETPGTKVDKAVNTAKSLKKG